MVKSVHVRRELENLKPYLGWQQWQRLLILSRILPNRAIECASSIVSNDKEKCAVCYHSNGQIMRRMALRTACMAVKEQEARMSV